MASQHARYDASSSPSKIEGAGRSMTNHEAIENIGCIKMRNLIKQLNYLYVLNISMSWLTGFCKFANNQINQKNQLLFIFDTASYLPIIL